MGWDKALLGYTEASGQGKPQIECAYDLLAPFCARVFISTRPDQGKQPGYERLAQIQDLPQFTGIGPLGGILSAMTTYPQAAWLVLACDLPFVTQETIRYLLEHRDPEKSATAFISTHDGLPEPLCAVWEAGNLEQAGQWLQQGIQCPRKLLAKSGVCLVEQKDPHWLDNVNDPKEYKKALKKLNKP